MQEEKTNLSYQQEFRALSLQYQDDLNAQEWSEIYKKLSYWELEIDNTENKSMAEILNSQKSEANAHFSKFIEKITKIGFKNLIQTPHTFSLVDE